jgi:hypothetical protein
MTSSKANNISLFHTKAMLCTKGAPTTALPKAITKVLNSQACHGNVVNTQSVLCRGVHPQVPPAISTALLLPRLGAIRFGDSLSTEKCVDLMASLSTCDLPFQCAHGRYRKSIVIYAVKRFLCGGLL